MTFASDFCSSPTLKSLKSLSIKIKLFFLSDSTFLNFCKILAKIKRILIRKAADFGYYLPNAGISLHGHQRKQTFKR